MPSSSPLPASTETITFGAGCFWCTEAIFAQQPGVISALSGYMGGVVKNPGYEQVCKGTTGHAEVTQVVFAPSQTTLEALLKTFWHAHDPTTLNRQGADEGTQYRSAIFYSSEAQKVAALKSREEAQKDWRAPIVTEITPASEFYPAENYHQDYYRLNKNQNPYCAMVIRPKLQKLGLES